MIGAACIRRPVATLLLSLGVLLLGVIAYVRLPIAALPSVDRPSISVYAGLPGASPETMASSVGIPLERRLGIIPGIAEMASIATPSGQEIDIQFTLEKTLDSAGAAVQAAINAALPDLPHDLPAPPTYYKADPGGVAMIVLAFTSDVLAPGDVYDFADSVVAQKMSQIPGVSHAVINGAERAAVRVRLDPRRMAQMGLSMETVRAAIDSATRLMPKGRIDRGDTSFALAANDQLLRAAEYRTVVVAFRNGAAVRLGDIADISDSVLNDLRGGWFNGQPAVTVLLYRQPDANIVETVDQVLKTLPQLEHWMPPSVHAHVVFDRTTLIRASIADVERTIGIAMVLVVMVVALFVRRLGATMIPALTIPVALAGTLAVMSVLGFNLDNLSLMALTIAVGFVVDDAVIIIEAVIRRMEAGQGARAAAIAATEQLGGTIVSITAALVAALIPVLFMPDIVGRYFREFGLTLVAALVISAAISLTLTPMLCARLRPVPGTEARPGRLMGGYAAVLGWCLRHARLAATGALVAALASYGVYRALPKGFMPTQDTGVLHIVTIANPNISFAAMQGLQRRVDAVVLADPAVAAATSYLGGTTSFGNVWIGLKPLEQRDAMPAVIDRLRTKLGAIAGIRSIPIPVQDLTIGLGGSGRYQVQLTGTDLAAVERAGDALRLRMLKLPQLVDVISNVDLRAGLQAGLVVDRMQAARLGVTPLAIDNTLYDAFGQRQVGLVYLPLSYSKVVMEVDPRFAGTPGSINQLFVPGAGGAQVPLGQMLKPWRSHAPMWVRHAQQFPTMAISFNTAPGVAVGQAVAAVRAAQAQTEIPDEVKVVFTGEAGAASQAGWTQVLLFLAAVFAVYVVLGVLYESYAHPLTILSTLPPATLGALLALWATGQEFGIMTAIACILVVGMVMKNAILLVDFAVLAERDGLDAREAMRRAALQRVRPITMTMLVAVLSALPLALGTRAGHELRQPLGIAVVGGLVVAQLFTLLATPAVYVVIDGLRRRRPRALPA